MLFSAEKTGLIVVLVVWIIAAIIILSFMRRGPNYRTSLEMSSFITCFVVIIFYIITIGLIKDYSYDLPLSSISAMLFLYSVYTSFVYLPGLIALRRISLEKGKSIGVCAAYLGFTWVFVMIVSGIVLAVITGKDVYTDVGQFVSFYLFGFCGLLLFIFLLVIMKPTKSIAVYLFLLLVSVVSYFVIIFSEIDSMYIDLYLVELPNLLAIICAAIFGHSWKVNVDRVEVPASNV